MTVSPILRFSISISEGVSSIDLEKKIYQFIQNHYPSDSYKNQNKLSFSNKLFRVKLSRKNNLLKGFFEGVFTLDKKTKSSTSIHFEGKLYRLIFISLIQGLVFCIAWVYAMSFNYLFVPALFALFSYCLQAASIHYLLPRAVLNCIKEENSPNS